MPENTSRTKQLLQKAKEDRAGRDRKANHSIYMKNSTYALLKAHCEAAGVSLGDFVEAACLDAIAAEAGE